MGKKAQSQNKNSCNSLRKVSKLLDKEHKLNYNIIMSNLAKSLIGVSVLAVIALIAGLLCLNHVTVNHVGVAYNSLNGDLSVQTNAGWYVTSPFVKVVSLNTLPISVHIPSEARVINTKIVRLKPDETSIKNYVAIQGFGYKLAQFHENILMGYAFSGQSYDFIEVIQQGDKENAPKSNR